jgi:1-acyl-sn-glycerol-3-phosphate acyltransferase
MVFLVLASLFWPIIMATPRQTWRWALARLGIRWLRRLTGVRLSVSGREHLPAPGQSFVLVANHQSYLDGLALAEAVGRPIGFIAKRELIRRPIVALFMRRMGASFVDRFDPHAGSVESTRLIETLRAGATLGFFPEGTFREQPGLLPFRMGAFVAAAQAGVPILPVVLNGTRKLMPGDSFRPSPGHAEVIVGPAIQPSGDDWEAAIRLRDEARRLIAERLDQSS